MQYDAARRKYVVRWREDGRQRVRRLDTPEEAEAFERRRSAQPAGAGPQDPEIAALAARLAELEAQLAGEPTEADAPGDGVFAYRTSTGPGTASSSARATAPPVRAAAMSANQPPARPSSGRSPGENEPLRDAP